MKVATYVCISDDKNAVGVITQPLLGARISRGPQGLTPKIGQMKKNYF